MAIYIVSLFLITGWNTPSAASSGSHRFRITVIPFTDTANPSTGGYVTNLLQGKLSENKNIAMLPSETANETVYRMEPSYLSGERQSGTDKGSMLWDIDKETVSGVIINIDADYAISGKISHFGNRWAIDSYISRKNETDPAAHFFSEGKGTKTISSEVGKMAGMIARWIDADNSTANAENHLREYLSGNISLTAAISGTRELVVRYPDSIPVRAVLLELYLKEKDHFWQELTASAREIALLLSRNKDQSAVRYLMSTQIDPFEILASGYEKNGKLETAIKTRHQALALLPFGMKRHRILIGQDHLGIAKRLEAMGKNSKAALHYREASRFLGGPSSKYFKTTKSFKKPDR